MKIMERNTRFSILTFPQFFDGNRLKVNVVFLPRNQNPLMPAIEGVPSIPDSPAFADAKLKFVAKIIPSLSGLPSETATIHSLPLSIEQSINTRPLFESLSNIFQDSIKNKNIQNNDANINNSDDKPPDPKSISLQKYLPLSYRTSFNFVSPRTRNALQ